MKALVHHKTIASKTGICMLEGGWIYHHTENPSITSTFLVFKRYIL